MSDLKSWRADFERPRNVYELLKDLPWTTIKKEDKIHITDLHKKDFIYIKIYSCALPCCSLSFYIKAIFGKRCSKMLLKYKVYMIKISVIIIVIGQSVRQLNVQQLMLNILRFSLIILLKLVHYQGRDHLKC